MSLPIFHKDLSVTFDGTEIIGHWSKGARATHSFRHLDGTELNERYPILVLKREIRRKWHPSFQPGLSIDAP